MHVQIVSTEILLGAFESLVFALEAKQIKPEEFDEDQFSLIRLELEQRGLVTFH